VLGQEDLHELLPPAAADQSLSLAKIRTAIASNDFPSAQAAIENLIKLAPKNFEGYFWRGFLEFQKHNYSDAVLSLRRAQALDSNIQILKVLGLSYYFLGQFRLFARTMQEAIEREPKDFAPYYYLGRYYASTDSADFAKATGYLQIGLQRKPDHYPSHYYLGYCEESERKLKEAEAEYLRSIELSDAAGQPFASPQQGMARLRLLNMKPLEALPFARKAVSLDARDASGHEVLARVYTDLHRPAEAATEWKLAAELEPTNPAPFYRLYRIYLEAGNEQDADKAFATYKSLVAIYGSN
jgi:tetratricopeptide (TPR) repeat protein